MRKIYINAGHLAYSPGGVYKGRREHSDVLRFSSLLERELKKEGISAVLYEGPLGDGFNENDIILSFHRDSNMKNEESHGAYVTLPADADASVQYDAFRLMSGLCSDGGFKYRGVHTYTKKCPHKSICKTGTPFTFVFTLGFMDNDRDNDILDNKSPSLIRELAGCLKEIEKEAENENNS